MSRDQQQDAGAPAAATPELVLADIDPQSHPGAADRDTAEREVAQTQDELAALQERLYAESKGGGTRSVLLVVQGMDTSGKGGIMRHVVGTIDPQGVKITGFKAPTDEEKSHDFLWRIRKALPPVGIVGVFDRSHYEDVLIHRVRGFSSPEVIEERYGLITEFERELTEAGTTVRKVMLHISSDEQKARLMERLDRPDKHWKFNPGDIDEREHWAAYQEAYEIALRRTSTSRSPWFVVPADRKWYARWAVHHILLETLRGLDPQWPTADFDVDAQRARLHAT
jgi:PPK2 family polyphosphate:nucleotide phosphotransferase